MNSFLREARKLIALREPLVLVTGNESCDLDSAVSALALAYFYATSTKTPASLLVAGERRFLPLLNIPRQNLPLKTEVVHFLQRNNIEIENLVCCNEVPTNLYQSARFILVDHHVAKEPMSPERVIQIVDHRPLDQQNAIIPSDCDVTINQVGSCATLIVDLIRSLEESFAEREELLRLLWGPIVLDTANFSVDGDRARPLDIEINQYIENALNSTADDRAKLFDDLVKARSDISSLSSLQLMSKDLKIISNQSRSHIIAFPGFPILVEDFMKRDDAWQSLQAFADDQKCDMLILIGLKVIEGGHIRRDLGLIPVRNSQLTEQVTEAITSAENPGLRLEPKNVVQSQTLNGQFFEQMNAKASRKQILPIVQGILNQV